MSVAESQIGEETGVSNKVDYKFCGECSNLLYPREDRQLNKLLYVCKACSSVQESDAACTFRAQLSANVQETAGVVQNVANDPTVGDTDSDYEPFCTMCGDCLRCRTCDEPAIPDSESSHHHDGPEDAELSTS